LCFWLEVIELDLARLPHIHPIQSDGSGYVNALRFSKKNTKSILCLKRFGGQLLEEAPTGESTTMAPPSNFENLACETEA